MKYIIVLLLLYVTVIAAIKCNNPDEDSLNFFDGHNSNCYKVRTYVTSNRTDKVNTFYIIAVKNYYVSNNNVDKVTNYIYKTQDDIIKICGGAVINPTIMLRDDVGKLKSLFFEKKMAGYVLPLYIEFNLHKLRINPMINELDKNFGLLLPKIHDDNRFEKCAYNVLVNNGIKSNIEPSGNGIDYLLTFVIISTLGYIILNFYNEIFCNKEKVN